MIEKGRSERGKESTVEPGCFLVRRLQLSGPSRSLSAIYPGAGWDEVEAGCSSHSFLTNFLHEAVQGNFLIPFYKTGKNKIAVNLQPVAPLIVFTEISSLIRSFEIPALIIPSFKFDSKWYRFLFFLLKYNIMLVSSV